MFDLTQFQDRSDAGRQLARRLLMFAGRMDVVVLALPRGGVPVGYEVARALLAPLDVMIVRKLGVPGQEELAMGSVATGGVLVRNEEVISACHISDSVIRGAAAAARAEVERRERLYRDSRPVPDLAGKIVILVDDGIATGSTVRAAIRALGVQKPLRLVVAVPVAPESTCAELRSEGVEVVCLATPEPFFAIGPYYVSFPQLDDAEVRELLHDAAVWVESLPSAR